MAPDKALHSRRLKENAAETIRRALGEGAVTSYNLQELVQKISRRRL